MDTSLHHTTTTPEVLRVMGKVFKAVEEKLRRFMKPDVKGFEVDSIPMVANVAEVVVYV